VERRAGWVLGGVLIAAVAVRLYGLDAPLIDYHAMRQVHTAAIARDCYRKGLDILAARPDALNYPAATNFPLYAWIVAGFYKATGGVHEWEGRLCSLLFSVVTVFLIYRWASGWWGRRAGLWAALFFAATPASVFFGRAFMPEALMMLLMTGSFLAMSRWHATGKWQPFALGALLLGAAVAVKLTPGMLVVPFVWLAYERGGKRALIGPVSLLVLACALAPLVLWYRPSALAYLAPKSYDPRPGALTLHFYLQMLVNRPAGVLLGPAGYAAFLVGLLAFPAGRRDYAAHLWVAAAAAFFLAAARKNFALEYYNLPILPVGCALAGRGMAVLLSGDPFARIRFGKPLSRLARSGLGWSLAAMYLAMIVVGYVAHWRWEARYVLPTTRELLLWGAVAAAGSLALGHLSWGLSGRLRQRRAAVRPLAMACLAVALTAAASVGYLALMYRQRPDLLAAARTLAAVSAPSDKVLEATDKSFVVLYYADRRGWYQFRKQFRPDQVELLRDQGAAWLATTLLDGLEKDGELRAYLNGHYRVAARTPHVMIYDLRRPPAGAPASGAATIAARSSQE